MDRIGKLKTMIAGSPDDSFLKHALALEQLKVGADQDAEVMFREILDHEPDYVGSYYHLGKLLEKTGRIDEAITIYREGIQVAGKLNDFHARNELQMALQDLHDED